MISQEGGKWKKKKIRYTFCTQLTKRDKPPHAKAKITIKMLYFINFNLKNTTNAAVGDVSPRLKQFLFILFEALPRAKVPNQRKFKKCSLKINRIILLNKHVYPYCDCSGPGFVAFSKRDSFTAWYMILWFLHTGS